MCQSLTERKFPTHDSTDIVPWNIRRSSVSTATRRYEHVQGGRSFRERSSGVASRTAERASEMLECHDMA